MSEAGRQGVSEVGRQGVSEAGKVTGVLEEAVAETHPQELLC